MMKTAEVALTKSPLRRRFIVAIVVYTGIILLLWLVYQNIIHRAVSNYARENTILAADSLTAQIGAEFTQMGTITAAIAGSAFVQDFLQERDVSAYYAKAEIVAEIIEKAAFPITSSDSVIIFSADGNFYRFSGGLSHASCEGLYRMFQDAGAAYTVVMLDETLFFCYSTPVYEASGQLPVRVGNVVMLTGLDKARRMLAHEDAAADIDIALLSGRSVIISNNREIERLPVAEIEAMYGVVSVAEVAGTPLSVAAAIPSEALFPDSTMFFAMAAALLGLMLTLILVLYRYLSGYIFSPLEMAKQNMRLSLLASQMDAHFVVNTLQNIKYLADIGETEKSGRMAHGLAAILQHRHTGDELVNIFDDFQILENYIDIMNIKFDGKFQVEYEVDDRLEAYLIPGLILQPLAENALTHGLGNKEGAALLIVKGFIRDNRIVVEIADNGAGIAPAKLQALKESLAQADLGDFPRPGLHGVALGNIERRIRLRYGEGYGLALDSALSQGTTVTVTLPLVPDV